MANVSCLRLMLVGSTARHLHSFHFIPFHSAMSQSLEPDATVQRSDAQMYADYGITKSMVNIDTAVKEASW